MKNILRGLPWLFVGMVLGLGAILFIRVQEATSPPLDHTNQKLDTLIEQILYHPDLKFIAEHTEENPEAANTAEFGALPLLAAVSLQAQRTEIAEHLLDAGADPTLLSQGSTTTARHSSVTYSAWMGNEEMLRLLLSYRATSGARFADLSEYNRARAILEMEHPSLIASLDWYDD